MCRVKATIRKGLTNAEALVCIKTVGGGMARVVMGSRRAGQGLVEVREIQREANRVMIELPRETELGEWRVWVPADQLVNS